MIAFIRIPLALYLIWHVYVIGQLSKYGEMVLVSKIPNIRLKYGDKA